MSLHTAKTMEQLVEQNRRLVRANSVPLLQFDTGNIGDDGRSSELYLAVRNAGTGPARIVWFELLQDGRPVRNYQDLLPANAKAAPEGRGRHCHRRDRAEHDARRGAAQAPLLAPAGGRRAPVGKGPS